MEAKEIELINSAFETIAEFSPQRFPADLQTALEKTLEGLNTGSLRVCEKKSEGWIVNTWIKKAILLYFKTHDNHRIEANPSHFYDKIPLKYQHFTENDFKAGQVRVVPPAFVRFGAYIAPGCVLMPSYVNIGAYIDSGCMIDTWATVGSCVQIGKNVHLSGGAGLGGVLEPLQANPTIIEDNCFIGARSEIVEGVIIGEGSVISMGVFIGASTKIYHRETDTVSYGYVPPGSVVVPGSLPDSRGKCHLYSAIIVKQVDLQTRQKVGLNQILREALAS